MKFFLVAPMSYTPIEYKPEQSTWDRLSVNKELVLFEPSEDTYELVGNYFLMGDGIQFKSLAEPVEVPELLRLYVLSNQCPDIDMTKQGRIIRLSH